MKGRFTGKCRKNAALVMAAAVCAVSIQMPDVAATGKNSQITSKTLKFDKGKKEVAVGKKVKILLKNSTRFKVKKVTWSVSKGEKYIKLVKSAKSYATVKGLKKGVAAVKAKIRIGTKSVTRTAMIAVKEAGGENAAEKEPSEGPAGTAAPSEGPAGTAAPSEGPAGTAAPSEGPAGTDAPDATLTPVEVKELVHYDMSLSEDGKTLLDMSGNGNDAELVDVSSEKRENDSLFLKKDSYIKLPANVFAGRDTFTVSIWLKSVSGAGNTSGMFVGTKQKKPVSYWLLNPSNPEGRMKSVMTDSKNSNEPWNTEVGISPSVAGNGVTGPVTDKKWNHYVTVITPNEIIGYYNGEKVGSSPLHMKFSDFGDDLAAYIGRSSYEDPTWIGYVGEVNVYQGIKTDDDVKALFESGKVEDNVEWTPEEETDDRIFIADRADPYIIKGDDGYYYFTASYPMYGGNDSEGYDRITLRRSETIEGLKTAEEKTVWDEKDSSASHRFIWAPELHYIGGKWYLYYAGSGSSSNVWDINCRVLMCKGDDPYNDSWEEKGKFQAAEGDDFAFTRFSLDMTYFEANGKSYVIWAQQGPASNLYMAEVDPGEPWKATTKSMLLTKPEYPWECVNIPVNEGPSVIIHEGKVIVAYSASATGPEYCIGFMYADEGADLMDISSWTKQKTAALTSDDLTDEYGPGHNSFTKDEEGNDIFVYHSRSKRCYEGRCGYGSGDPLYDPCRSARIRKVVWGEDGLPILNVFNETS